MDFDFIHPLFQEIRNDIKGIHQEIASLQKEFIEIKSAKILYLEKEFSDFKKTINGPKRLRKMIIMRVIIAILAATIFASFAWVGDLLYKTPSPYQQKLISTLETHLLKKESEASSPTSLKLFNVSAGHNSSRKILIPFGASIPILIIDEGFA